MQRAEISFLEEKRTFYQPYRWSSVVGLSTQNAGADLGYIVSNNLQRYEEYSHKSYEVTLAGYKIRRLVLFRVEPGQSLRWQMIGWKT